MEQAIMAMYAGFSVLFGLVFGSFANVLIARLPRDASLLTPSHCPRCGSRVRWYDLTPVLAWFWLRGRCRDCGSRIAPTYPAIELLGGLLGYLLFVRLFQDLGDLALPNVIAYVLFGGFVLALVVAFFIDLRHQIIPEITSSWLIPVGVLGHIALWATGYTDFPADHWEFSVLGALFWGGLLGAVALIARLIRGADGMGFGDAKFLAMIGAFCGIQGAFLVMMFASMLGVTVHLAVIIARRRSGFVAFGPSLAVSALFYVFYGDILTELIMPGTKPFLEYMILGIVPS